MSPTILYIIIGYVLLMVIAYFIQEKFIFKPEKLAADFEFKYDAPFKEVSFNPEPGVTISGIHFNVKKPHGLIIYFHGNTRSIKGWGKYARDFFRFGYDVLLVDYRGFGKSIGKRSEVAMLRDMQFVYDQLCLQFPEDHILVYGRSMGSGFASKLAADNHPRYLILDAPYYSFRKVVERFLPFLPIRLVLRFHLRTDKWIKEVKCHTYIIHGTKDWLIPIRHSERLQAINPRRITLIRIHGGGHNNLPTYPEYHNFIRDILKV
ncbi:alpha/beta hydrolase [Lacibacter sp.]|uniref:alpha/beta hydrolase n=1 Tax=Lacibacter sp. TaxID=1915409 RepID=UPI002B4B0B8B|nr:alpha/beta fold hydrolase [Lacibacter sp.]HLP38306.1 alpha/beta fold hydrolase [Lacibacter sp.]